MGTIVVDSSALLALLFLEDDAGQIATKIADSDEIFISAVSYAEAGIVLDNRQYPSKNSNDLDELIETFAGEIIALDKEQAKIARIAYQKFGKGKHPAKLNMGDCFSYALAKQMNVPLLYKGDDFSKTDITSALQRQDK